jgi:hypothetical protein
MQNLNIQTNSRFTLITIVNWHTYQDALIQNEQANDQAMISRRSADDQPVNTTKNDKNEKNKKPPDFSSQIFSLKQRYPNPQLIDLAIQAFASVRKCGKVADSVICAQLKKWARHPAEQVEAGIRTYLEKDCAGQGKDEKYLLGIIRNQKAPEGQRHESTGSALLDNYYAANRA